MIILWTIVSSQARFGSDKAISLSSDGRSLTHHIYIQLFVQCHISVDGKAGEELQHKLEDSSIELDVIEAQPVANNLETDREQKIGHLIRATELERMTFTGLHAQISIHKIFVDFIGRIIATPIINIFIQ